MEIDVLIGLLVLNVMLSYVHVESCVRIEDSNGMKMLVSIQSEQERRGGDFQLERKFTKDSLLCNILGKFSILIVLLVVEELKNIQNPLVLT